MRSFLSKNLVLIGGQAADAEEAIQLAGDLLYKEGCVNKNYTNAMIQSYKDNGAYFVITPNVAIPHARNEDGVNRTGVSLVILNRAVSFGHPTNDPVILVFGLASSSNQEHLETIQKIVQLLNSNRNIEGLKKAKTYDDVKHILEELP